LSVKFINMKNENKSLVTGRRDALKTIGLGSAAMLSGNLGNLTSDQATQKEKLNKTPVGLSPIKIKSVKAIGVNSSPQGNGRNLVVVKVETTEPGLYGLGCATFTQRAFAVITAVDRYLNEFCIGRDADNIEDMWHAAYVSSYWRNGPVLNNALSGLDMALWDIKGKRANMPVYQLLGGKCRFAIETLGRGGGATPEEVADNVLKQMESGYRYFRIGAERGGENADFREAGFGLPRDGYIDDHKDLRELVKTFEVVRKRCGDEVLLGHDLHERYQPMDVINFCRRIEQYGPISFIEDPLSPENTRWWKQMRESTTVPFAMGELFNNVNEFIDPMVNHYFDYIRIHVSQMGGITPCMKVARLGEWFNVRTIWHGPGDVSPVGHSAMAHMDLATWNFAAQEGGGDFSDFLYEMFPGSLTKKGVYIHVNELPGLGIDINEKMAAKYPIGVANRNAVRKKDGTVIRS
jgi:mannonate dehydratase